MSKRKSLSVEVKQTKITEANTSVTPSPQFDIVEANSIRKDAIDLLYDPTTPKEHKESFKRGIRRIEEQILDNSFNQWVSTGKMPEELGYYY